jgi:hypothetical protein
MPPAPIPNHATGEVEQRWILAFGIVLFVGATLVAVLTARETMLALKSRIRREQR